VSLPIDPSQDQSSTHEGHLHVHGTPNPVTDRWSRANMVARLPEPTGSDPSWNLGPGWTASTPHRRTHSRRTRRRTIGVGGQTVLPYLPVTLGARRCKVCPAGRPSKALTDRLDGQNGCDVRLLLLEIHRSDAGEQPGHQRFHGSRPHDPWHGVLITPGQGGGRSLKDVNARRSRSRPGDVPPRGVTAGSRVRLRGVGLTMTR